MNMDYQFSLPSRSAPAGMRNQSDTNFFAVQTSPDCNNNFYAVQKPQFPDITQPGHLFLTPDHETHTDSHAPPTLCETLHSHGFTHTHRLHCGHMVRTSLPTTCGSNCILTPFYSPRKPKHDVVALRFLCLECIVQTPGLNPEDCVGRETRPDWVYGVEGNIVENATREGMERTLIAAGLVTGKVAEGERWMNEAMTELGGNERDLSGMFSADEAVCEAIVHVLAADATFFERFEARQMVEDGLKIQGQCCADMQTVERSVEAVAQRISELDLAQAIKKHEQIQVEDTRDWSMAAAVRAFEEMGELDPAYLAWNDDRMEM